MGFRNQQLVQPAPHLLKVIPTRKMVLTTVLSIVMPLLVVGLIYLFRSGPSGAKLLWLLLICSAGSLSAVLVFYRTSRSSVFDLQAGTCTGFYTEGGYRTKRYVRDKKISLEHIHALQLLREKVPSMRNSGQYFYSYELNMVLKNGTRYQLMDHADIARLREDARTLSQVLQVPVWDATLGLV